MAGPFTMKYNNSSFPFKSSPAKKADVYIDGENVGTGPEAVKAGITAERENEQLDVGLESGKKAKEVTYTDADAKARLSKSLGKEKEIHQTQYKKTGTVRGRGTTRAEASKGKIK